MAKRNNDQASKILVEAVFFPDTKVANRHNITVRTIQNYRAALQTDTELSLLFARHLAVFLGHDEGGKELEVAEAQIALQHWIAEMEIALSQMVGEAKSLWLELRKEAGTFQEKMAVFSASLSFMAQLGEPLIVKEVLNGSSERGAEGESTPQPSEDRPASSSNLN